MVNLSIADRVAEKLKGSNFGLIQATIINTPHHEGLWREIESVSGEIREKYALDEVKHQPEIAAAREAYKKLGKDPNRYRPSAEALYRRLIKGYPLYKISTAVDLINYISLKTGYSINGFDAEKISGQIILGIGRSDEPFEAIGRGALNIENLPVYHDAAGAIGSPTSDSVRTSIEDHTKSVYLVVNDFSGNRESLGQALEISGTRLKEYCRAEALETVVVAV